jgi:hypothetical protein
MISESGLERQTTHVDEGHQIRSDQLRYATIGILPGGMLYLLRPAGRATYYREKKGGEEERGDSLSMFFIKIK